MRASTVSVSQLPNSKHARSVTALAILLLLGAALISVAPRAQADDGRVVLSTGLGAVAGALIGQSVGGRNATIVGGAIGAAIGASAATENGHRRNAPAVGHSSGYYQGGYAAPVVYAPPVMYRPAPVYRSVYQPVYQPVYRSVVRPVIYPVAYYGGYGRGYGEHYDSDDRHGGGNDRGDRGNRGDRGGWDSDRGNSGYRR